MPEYRRIPSGTAYDMPTANFDLEETLSDLRSDEGIDPAMIVVSMPPLWSAALKLVFATAN